MDKIKISLLESMQAQHIKIHGYESPALVDAMNEYGKDLIGIMKVMVMYKELFEYDKHIYLSLEDNDEDEDNFMIQTGAC
jgi:hypothetical protein